MHLGHTLMPWPDMVRLARATQIRTRLLVVDGCLSGVVAPGGSVTHVESLSGLAIVASLSPDESSRESAALRGAMFTQHLLAALNGVGDANGDGRVSLGRR